MSFIAKYRGTCEDCGDDVEPGQEATFLSDHKSIRHVKCPEGHFPDKPGEVCPRCFTEIPVSGVCGVCE